MGETIDCTTCSFPKKISNSTLTVNPTVCDFASARSRFNLIDLVTPILTPNHEAKRKLLRGFTSINSDFS